MDLARPSQAPHDMMNTKSIRHDWFSLLSLATLLGACGGQALDVGSNADQVQNHAGAGDVAGSGGTAAAAGGSGNNGGATTGAAGSSEPECPCSRRPGASSSFQCAMGVGETTTMDIGPAGGVLAIRAQQGKSSGVSFLLEVPPNALLDEVTATLTETSEPPPGDLIDYSPVYLVEPTDVTARFPMKLTVPFGSNHEWKSLAIYVADTVDGPFEPIGDSYTNAGFMQGSTTRFGAFLVAAPRPAALADCP